MVTTGKGSVRCRRTVRPTRAAEWSLRPKATTAGITFGAEPLHVYVAASRGLVGALPMYDRKVNIV